MIIRLENQQLISGSEIMRAVFRSSLEPIPCTFEAEIRLNPDIAPFLLEEKILKAGRNETAMQIVYAQDRVSPQEQGGMVVIRHIIALHANSRGIGYRLNKAVVREKISLSEIYQSCGGKSAIEKDFTVPRFYCYRGFYPSQQIAKICQEHGGVVRWHPDNDTVAFTRIHDLFNQTPKVHHPTLDTAQRSSFLERHEVPSYISTDAAGRIIKGDFDKPRSVQFSPGKSEAELMASSNVLLNAKTVPSEYAPDIHAGDLIQENGRSFVVITAAHSISRHNGVSEDSSVFWLGVKS